MTKKKDTQTETKKKANKTPKNRRAKILNSNVSKPKELNGPKGLEPTRYGDWERKGRVSDF